MSDPTIIYIYGACWFITSVVMMVLEGREEYSRVVTLADPAILMVLALAWPILWLAWAAQLIAGTIIRFTSD